MTHDDVTLHSGDCTITRLRQDNAAHAEFIQDDPADAYVLMVKVRAATTR